MLDESLYTPGDKLKCIKKEPYWLLSNKYYTIKGVRDDKLIMENELPLDALFNIEFFDTVSYIRNKKINEILD